jgi:circadian clock protein KaiB
MESPGSKGRQSEPFYTEKILLRLYVAGRAPNSARAIMNLNSLCLEHFSDPYEIEIIDVLENPTLAIADHILATPTLVKVSPPPVQKIIGNLSEKSKVLMLLGLKEDNR